MLSALTCRNVCRLLMASGSFVAFSISVLALANAADNGIPRVITLAQAKAINEPAKESIKVPAKEDKSSSSNRTVITPEREAAVSTFVRLHHPELEALLTHLSEARPKEYDKALRELFRVTERLGQIQDRDAELYELELRLWKTQSRLQLLLARLHMGENADLKRQVREAVQEQFEVKVVMLERQEKKLSEQASKALADLAKLKADKDQWIERQINMLTPVTATSTSNKNKPTNTPNSKNPGGKPVVKEPVRKEDESSKPTAPPASSLSK